MLRRKALAAIPALTALALSVGAAPAGAADGTAVSIGNATVGTGSITVSGTVAYGTDATGAVTLGTDGSGDAVPPAPGMDLGNVTVRTDIAAKRLVWTLGINNGLPDPVGGPAPALMGYMVPIMVDGDDKWRWLAAGTAGTALGQTGKWTGLCHNETSTGAQGGWGCPGALASPNTFSYSGSITTSSITWTQPFGQMKPAIQYGSQIDPSSIHCSAPCSFAWPPGALGAAAPIDRLDSMMSYKVPGEVLIAVAPSGTTPDSFETKATFNATTGAFTGSIPKPGTAGTYTVWASTCFGLVDSPTCVTATRDLTV